MRRKVKILRRQEPGRRKGTDSAGRKAGTERAVTERCEKGLFFACKDILYLIVLDCVSYFAESCHNSGMTPQN